MRRVIYLIEQRGAKLRYAERGGGIYSQKEHAEKKVRELRKAGGKVKLFVCYPEWEEVEVVE